MLSSQYPEHAVGEGVAEEVEDEDVDEDLEQVSMD